MEVDNAKIKNIGNNFFRNNCRFSSQAFEIKANLVGF